MKKHYLIILFTIHSIVLYPGGLYGQNFVTEPKNMVIEHFNSQSVEYSINRTSDGFEVLHLKDGQITVEYYFNKDEICFVYRMLFPEEGLVESIEALNFAFTKVKERMWLEYDGQQYFIWSLDKTGNGFSLSVFTEASLKGNDKN